jgi:uncharacterized protein
MTPELLLGQLLKTAGNIRGRKKLQKIVHLLQSLRGVRFGYSFQFSFFGPYSADLKADMDQLTREGLINETPSSTSTGLTTFDFSLSGAMEKLLEDVHAASPSGWDDLAVKLNAKSAQDLEGISTIVFLERMGWAGEALEDQFRTLKPRLAENFHAFLTEAEALKAA